MKVRFKKLILTCKESIENIQFASQVSFFHGEISSGKSSVARLVDFCLGSDLEMTPAISREGVSAELVAEIGDNSVKLRRSLENSRGVEVAWQGKTESGQLTAPISPVPGAPAIWQDDVHNVSDLIFHLSGFSPIRVPRSRMRPDSQMIRLSFRDIMWYCYLTQEELVSTFFNLRIPFKEQKSRDVMRFVVGYYTERLAELRERLSELASRRQELAAAAKERKSFLEAQVFESETTVRQLIDRESIELAELERQLATQNEEYKERTHIADQLREELRAKSRELANEEQTSRDLTEKIEEQKSLKSELLSAMVKHSRIASASAILSGVSFLRCPACGEPVRKDVRKDGVCSLCGKSPSEKRTELMPEIKFFRKDLDVRIEELTDSINRHEKALGTQVHRISVIKQEKADLDSRLEERLREYDSRYLAGFRELERKAATVTERIRGLKRFQSMFESVSAMENEAGGLVLQQKQVQGGIEQETRTLSAAVQYVDEIANVFLHTMIRVGIPSVTEEDTVLLDPSDWNPRILPRGNRALKYDFFNAGSAGKKTLMKTCYALAVHIVASRHNLPLPTFLMIDTPMQHIGEDVDKAIFVGFYKHLYELAAGPLSNHQFIIIDKEFVKPDASLTIDLIERYMTRNQPENPPLISYYRGP